MGVFSLKPARLIPPRENVVVADLDALLSENVAFQFQGRTHVLRPVDLQTFLRVLNKYQTLLGSKQNAETLTTDKMIEMYGDFFSEVCETIGRKEVAQMTVQQVAALFNLVCQTLMGNSQVDDSKKKVTTP